MYRKSILAFVLPMKVWKNTLKSRILKLFKLLHPKVLDMAELRIHYFFQANIWIFNFSVHRSLWLECKPLVCVHAVARAHVRVRRFLCESVRRNFQQWSISGELKVKFDPSLDRSSCEFFNIIKNHGPKNPPQGCNLGPKFPPHVGRSPKTNDSSNII